MLTLLARSNSISSNTAVYQNTINDNNRPNGTTTLFQRRSTPSTLALEVFTKVHLREIFVNNERYSCSCIL